MKQLDMATFRYYTAAAWRRLYKQIAIFSILPLKWAFDQYYPSNFQIVELLVLKVPFTRSSFVGSSVILANVNESVSVKVTDCVLTIADICEPNAAES